MPLTIKNQKRGRPPLTLIEQAYQQGLKDGGGSSYGEGFKAGYQKAVDMYYQAIRFLKFEGTMEGTIRGVGNQTPHGLRGNEVAGSGRDEGANAGLEVQGQTFANS